MNKEFNEKVAHHFHGITVLVPKERDNEIAVIDMGSYIPHTMRPKTDDFTVIRHIANIVLADKASYEKGRLEPIMTFNLPIEIRVAYNYYDVMQCDCDINQLKLAFWNGEKWVILSDAAHEYQILPPGTAQVAEAKIWTWAGDPPLAWGK
jgi:hypothetical protein